MDSTIDREQYIDWIDYCFTPSRFDDVSASYEHPPPKVLAMFLIELFTHSSRDLGGRSLSDIGAGIWYLFGNSEYMHTICEHTVPKEQQIHVIVAMRDLYATCDRLADHGGKRKPTSTNDLGDLDGAVYMIWDITPLPSFMSLPNFEYLRDPIFDVYKYALGCSSVTCQLSALHGLGHSQYDFPERVKLLIEPYIRQKRAAAPWLLDYARYALQGRVL